MSQEPFGVYLHVPFCASRCDYCAFVTFTDRDHMMAPVVAAMVRHLARAEAAGRCRPATSVYVGGGTPSRLPASSIVGLLRAVELAPGAEVTVEVNPEDVGDVLVERLLAGGVNRFSFGIQSTAPHVLEALGRRHGPNDLGEVAAAMARHGVENWSVDLIFGARGEREEDLLASLSAVLDLPNPPPHVSAYALSAEKGTPIYRDLDRHPDDEVLADRYEIVDEVLSAAGYGWEEISSWARPGFTCAHHHLYWTGGEYLGVGPGAHGFEVPVRYANHATPERYVEAIEALEWPVATREVLDAETMAAEALALELRTSHGVPGWALPEDPALDGLVERRAGRAVLTRRGRLLANEVAMALVVPST